MDPKRRLLHILFAVLLLVAPVSSAQQTSGKPPAPNKDKTTGPSKSAELKKRPRIIPDLSGFELTEPEMLKRQPMVVGATRGFPTEPKAPEALAPHLGKVYALDPIFVWSDTEGHRKTEFALTDSANVEIFRTPVSGAQFHYGAAAPALEPGRTYFWRLEVSSASGSRRSSTPAGIVVVGAAERNRIDAALAAIHEEDARRETLARAKVFTDFRIWYDAIAAYTDLIAGAPQRPELYEARGNLYAQFQVTRALAEQDFTRADSLE